LRFRFSSTINFRDMRQLLGLKQAAAILSISYARAAELARTGMLPVVRLGRQVRIDPQQLELFIAQGGKALPGGWRRTQD
jgi:excisionase family DNA binding protein